MLGKCRNRICDAKWMSQKHKLKRWKKEQHVHVFLVQGSNLTSLAQRSWGERVFYNLHWFIFTVNKISHQRPDV